jgi:uncharacterized protein
MFQRPQLSIFKQRLTEPRGFLQVLAGPRQVGKTTLIQQLLAMSELPSLFVSADDVPITNAVWLEQQWETARLHLKQSEAADFVLVIDEVQKLGNWSETVKKQWDADTRNGIALKVILLGSSRLLLQAGLTESLTGRYELTYLPFDFSAAQFAWFGGYPGAARLIQDETRWRRYVNDALIDPSISRDILMLTRVDKPVLLRRLFEFGCLYSGQLLSYNKMLGQLQDAGNTTTLAHYLDLLDAAGLLCGLEKYAGDKLRQRLSSPKFQVHNTALMAATQVQNFADTSLQPKLWGRVVESAIGAHLVNYARQEGFKVYYWREGNDEVDFVLEMRGKTIAIEVKSGAKETNLSGMTAFQKQFQPDKLLLISNTGLTWESFLTINPIDLF